MNEYKNELDRYRDLYKVAEKGGVVFFGSTFAKNIPAAELGQALQLNCSVYNRSFSDLSVFDALEILDEAVLTLYPKKIILHLGEIDIERGYKSIEEISAAYEQLVLRIKKFDKRIKIIIASMCSEEKGSDQLNAALEKLSSKCRCQYADISKAKESEAPFISAFKMLKFFMLDRITFYDAMNLA